MTSSLSLSGISGYDFSGITEALISNYSKPLTTMQNSLSSLQEEKYAWQDINTRLSALENTLADLKKSSTWTGTSAVSSNETILTASSDSSTLKGVYAVEVIQLAKAQTAASAVQSVDTASTSLAGLTAGTFQISIGSTTADISVADGASLQDIATSINNAGAGVNASVVKVSGGYQLALVSSKTGTEYAADFTDTTGNVLDFLGIKPSATGTLNVVQPAQDAQLTINGITNITSSSNTVTTAIDGLTLNLNKEAVGTTVNVTVSADYTDAEKAVQAFVDQYNSLQTLIETDLAYDEAANTKGVLFGDPMVQSVQSRLRTLLSDSMGSMGGTFSLLSDVGIDTSSDNFGKSALLEFDTDAFAEALKEDADGVANLFGATAGGVTPVTETTETTQAQGLANILEEYLNPMVKYGGSLDQTEDGYASQISDLKSRMKDFQGKIDAYTERITNQYSKLEAQLSALSSESTYMTSLLSSMSSSSSSSDSKS